MTQRATRGRAGKSRVSSERSALGPKVRRELARSRSVSQLSVRTSGPGATSPRRMRTAGREGEALGVALDEEVGRADYKWQA